MKWIVLLTSLKHLIVAGLLIADPMATGQITSNVIPIWALKAVGCGQKCEVLIYLASAVVTAIFFFTPSERWPHKFGLWITHLAAALTQQFLLVLSAIGSGIAIWQGAYLDGTRINRAHLLGDQDVYILIAIFHGVALADIFAKELLLSEWERIKKWRRRHR